MANKAISELPQAQNVNNQDLFVLEQSGIAKKLTAETFITEQGIIDALAEALDGHGGIQSVTLSSVSGRIRTYLITFTDETTTTFQVLDGTSIDRIVKTSTAGLTDTYTVFMNDGTTTFFTVTNGADGDVSEAMLNDALKDKAPAVTETTESSAIANFPDGADNMAMHNVVAEINPVQDLTYGDPYPAGGGKNKFYSSISNSVTLNGVTCSFDANTQTFTINGANESSSAYILLSVTPTEDIVRNVALSRAFIGAPTGVYINLVYNDGSWHGLNNGETLPDSVSIENVRIQVGILGTAGSFTTTTFKCQLQEGSSAPASWTPYENICPITGWTGCNVTRTGKNLCSVNTISNIGWATDNASLLTVINSLPVGTYNMSYLSTLTSLDSESYLTSQWMTGFIFTNPSGNFTNQVSTSTSHPVGSTQTANKTLTITSSTVGAFTHAYVYGAGNNGSGKIGTATLSKIQFELGSTATAYEPYQGETVTVDWTTEAGTVYGGTIDVATGLLTVDRVINERLLSTFSSLSDSTNTTHYRYVDEFFPSGTGRAVADSTAICNIAPYAYNSTDTTHFYLSWYTQYNENRIELWVPKGTATTTPVQICAKLREPLTYQLTGQQLKTLLGTNNVQASTGNTSVTYAADTKLYIQNLTQPTEDDLVANQAITSGKYFMIGNSLYLALANIASGAQITIGTNAQRVSLADALNTINS